MKLLNLFRKERYPSYPSEWDNPEHTVFRNFYLRSGPDFALLRRLVEKHISDKGNDGITKHRLIKILYDCECRADYLMHKRRNYPRTWKIRWKIQCINQYFHRRLRTSFFKNQVMLCRIADEVIKEQLSKKDNNE